MKSITRRVGLKKKPSTVSCRIGNILSLRNSSFFVLFHLFIILCYLFVYNFELCHYYYLFIYLFTFLCFSFILLLFVVCFSFLFYKNKYIENCEINVVLLWR